MKRKRYSRKFQRMAVARMETCEDVGELARELGVRPRCLYKWRRKLEMVEPGQESSRPSTHASAHRKEIHRLKQLLAEKTLEVDFFRGALQKRTNDIDSLSRLCKQGVTGSTPVTSTKFVPPVTPSRRRSSKMELGRKPAVRKCGPLGSDDHSRQEF